jgi:hypothetical protein
MTKEKAESVAEFHRELKAEAVKEFAERVKAEMKNLSRMEYHCTPYFLVSESFIDNLVEKITEKKNETIF